MVDVVTITREPPPGFKGACAVYRFNDNTGALLYVGATENLQTRIASHSCRSKWFGMAEKVFVSWHKTREAALDVEAREIFYKKPMFNKSCSIGRISNDYRVKTRVKIFRTKQENPKQAPLREPASLAVDALRGWITAEGRKFGWLASRIPTDPSNLSRWIKGRIVPSQVYCHRIADITGIELVRERGNWGKVE